MNQIERDCWLCSFEDFSFADFSFVEQQDFSLVDFSAASFQSAGLQPNPTFLFYSQSFLFPVPNRLEPGGGVSSAAPANHESDRSC
jgi:hypothetical protein